MERYQEPRESIGCFCTRCGEVNPANFFKSQSGLHASGYLPVCKPCIYEVFDLYLNEFRSAQKAMQRVCMAFDIYYDKNTLANCDLDDSKFISKYLRLLNRGKQSKGRTFDDSITDGFIFTAEFNEDEYVIRSDEIDPELIKRWGVGLSKDDYEVLDDHYNYLKSANPRSDNNNQEIFINNLCYTQMQIMRAIREKDVDGFAKLSKTYKETFAQAGLKSAADKSELEDFTTGVTIETIERYTPAEYYKNKKRFCDHDGIKDYIERFMLRPLRNLQYGTADRDTEYYVKSDADDEVGDSDVGTSEN